MNYAVTKSSDGAIVVRSSSGPTYRLNKNGTIRQSLHDKGILLPCKWIDVPLQVKQLFAVSSHATAV